MDGNFTELFAEFLEEEEKRYRDYAMNLGIQYVYYNSFYIYTASRFAEVFSEHAGELEFSERQAANGNAYRESVQDEIDSPFLRAAFGIINCWDGFEPTREEDILEVIQNALNRNPEKRVEAPPEEKQILCLDDLLIKYFGTGFPLPECPVCRSYKQLISLLYDLGEITEHNMEEIVEDLDGLAAENAFRDEEGYLITDEKQIRELLDKQDSF